ncbi:MAG: hypothetical protein WCL14_14210 [Bacteroidota bacterium]
MEWINQFIIWGRAAAKRRSLFAAARLCNESCFEATCRRSIAPIVAAARCFVSEMGRQRLQRIAGRRWDEWRI